MSCIKVYLSALTLVLSALTLVLSGAPASLAEDNKLLRVVGGRYPTSTYARKHNFPEVGDYKQWEAADKLYIEAGKLDDLGKVKQARDKYVEAIQLYAHDMNFFNNYGLVLLKLHDEIGAETAWRYAISQKKNFWQAQNNLARLLFFQSRLAEAKYMWDRAAQSNPPHEVLQDINTNVALCGEKIKHAK